MMWLLWVGAGAVVVLWSWILQQNAYRRGFRAAAGIYSEAMRLRSIDESR